MGASRERIILTTAAGLAFVGLASLGLSFANGTSTKTADNAASSTDASEAAVVSTVPQPPPASVSGTPAHSVTNPPQTASANGKIRPSVQTNPSMTRPEGPGVPSAATEPTTPPVVTAQPDTVPLVYAAVSCDEAGNPGPWAVVLVSPPADPNTRSAYNDSKAPCKSSTLLTSFSYKKDVVGVYMDLKVACKFKENNQGRTDGTLVQKTVFDLSTGQSISPNCKTLGY